LSSGTSAGTPDSLMRSCVALGSAPRTAAAEAGSAGQVIGAGVPVTSGRALVASPVDGAVAEGVGAGAAVAEAELVAFVEGGPGLSAEPLQASRISAGAAAGIEPRRLRGLREPRGGAVIMEQPA
jgi:hypothetical protein